MCGQGVRATANTKGASANMTMQLVTLGVRGSEMRAAMRGTGSNAGLRRAAGTVQRVTRGPERWHEGAGGGMRG